MKVKFAVLLFSFFLIGPLTNSLVFSDEIEGGSPISLKTEKLSGFSDYIVARVEDQVITFSDIEEKLFPLKEHYKKIYEGKELEEKFKVAQRNVLEQLVQEKILKLKAEEAGIQVEEDRIEIEVERVKREFSSPKEFYEELEKNNLTLTELKKRLEEEMKIRRLLYRHVFKEIRVSEEEIKNFYEKYKDGYSGSAQVKISQILIRNSSKLEAKTTAEEIWKKLQAGEEFSALAKEYSQGPYAKQGGNLGFVHEEELLPPIRKTLSSLKIGQYTRPVESSLGYHIIKLEGRKLGESPPLSEIKAKIRVRIHREKSAKAYEKWMRKTQEEMDITILGFKDS